MNGLSLFSGIGGLDLGLEAAGIDVVGQVEIDPFCRSVLAHHWPEVPLHDDVNTFPDWWATTARPPVHLVFGGFPCQGHSVAGRQRGTADERWGWPGFRAAVEAVSAPLVLVENVPNLARTGLDVVLADLADLGFDAWWSRVPAAAVGAPHLRWRLILVAAHPERVDLRIEPRWSSGPDGAHSTVAGFDGATWSLADPDTVRRNRWAGHLAEAHGRDEPAHCGSSLADSADPRRAQVGSAVAGDGAGEVGLRAPEPGGRGLATDGACPWPAEPDVGRVAHGVPDRMDRLRTLGNAVVPAVATYVGRLIIETFEVPV